MGEAIAGQKLKAFRKDRALTMEAAAQFIVDELGEPINKTTWHGWEARGKIPKAPFMVQLERLIAGLEPNDFYPRPDAGELQPAAAPLQPAML